MKQADNDGNGFGLSEKTVLRFSKMHINCPQLIPIRQRIHVSPAGFQPKRSSILMNTILQVSYFFSKFLNFYDENRLLKAGFLTWTVSRDFWAETSQYLQ